MVPGSTFRYGSSLTIVVVMFLALSRRPSEAATIPLPREETTPPVTNTYLVLILPPDSTRGSQAGVSNDNYKTISHIRGQAPSSQPVGYSPRPGRPDWGFPQGPSAGLHSVYVASRALLAYSRHPEQTLFLVGSVLQQDLPSWRRYNLVLTHDIDDRKCVG